MADNLAYQEQFWDELLDGKPAMMSPRPTINHNIVMGNIYRAFGNYLEGKKCTPFAEGSDVYLTPKDRVIPDVMIVCNKDIVKRNGIYGAPDLVVEVLSLGTKKRDRGYKKDLYEKSGVREYWLVDPDTKTIEVYLLTDGKFHLDEVYQVFPEEEELSPEEQEDYKSQVKVSLYDDFYILAFTRDNPMAKRSSALYGELLMTNYDPTPFLADQLTLFGGQATEKLRLELVHIPKKSLITL